MNPLLQEYLTILFWYIIPCFCAGLIVLFIRFIIKPKDYIYRKVLHICAVSTILCFVLPATTWWISVLAILTILFLINATLLIVERFKLYKMLFVDKVTAIMAWGVGDAFAAIIGIQFGKNKFKSHYFDNRKSIEGTAAMFVACFAISLLTLIFTINYPITQVIVESLVIGLALSLIEAISKNGLDNIFCPLAASVILLLFSL